MGFRYSFLFKIIFSAFLFFFESACDRKQGHDVQQTCVKVQLQIHHSKLRFCVCNWEMDETLAAESVQGCVS